jgi:hypothetical protein
MALKAVATRTGYLCCKSDDLDRCPRIAPVRRVWRNLRCVTESDRVAAAGVHPVKCSQMRPKVAAMNRLAQFVLLSVLALR